MVGSGMRYNLLFLMGKPFNNFSTNTSSNNNEETGTDAYNQLDLILRPGRILNEVISTKLSPWISMTTA